MKRRPATDQMDWERPSERFLAYLDRLSAAVVARDREELDKLLRMRLSSHLPRGVLDEMEFFRRARGANLRAPLRLIRYHHKMRQLGSAEPRRDQLGLPLRERALSDPVADERRRTRTRDGGPARGARDD